MSGLNRESRQSIYFGVGYVIATPWVSDKGRQLDFQRSLLEHQLDFSDIRADERSFTLIRKDQSPLQIRLASLGPQVSNIIIKSEGPVHNIDLFSKEADAACDAYRQTWLGQGCHILQCDATIRHLYSCTDHAFKYLWKTRLGQQPHDFYHLGKRPVLGGGLRLVIPPIREDVELTQIEIKIESFLRESQKMFIETLFVWPQNRLLGKESKFDPEFRLKLVEKYAITEVWNFLVKPEIED
jgi:hypothetical protein